jgi:hypothetical protein
MKLLAALFAVAILHTACGSSDKPPPDGTGGAAAGTGGAGTGGGGGTGGTTPKDAASAAPDTAATGGSAGQPDTGAGGSGGGDTGPSPDGPVAADTWETFAKAFFTTYCVACHDDDKKGAATRDYHLLANVMKEKAEIACGVATPAEWTRLACKAFPPARQFPVGGGPKPTDADRERLVRWIDSGTP